MGSESMAIEPVGTGQYVSRITPLKGRSDRVDVEVAEALPVQAFSADIVAALRRLFDGIDAEAHDHTGDPVALTHALARLDTLLADIRYVRDTVRDLDAQALHDAKIRRLTVSGVATVEGMSSLQRTNWQHQRLMLDMLRQAVGPMLIMADTGETISTEDLAARILTWMKPDWRLTPIRDAGYDPDAYCDIETDDHGRPVRTPAVKMVDNSVRKMRT